MRRHLVQVDIERSPELVSALTAESMAVQDATADPRPSTTVELGAAGAEQRDDPVLDALAPPEHAGVVVAVNAPTAGEAKAKVRDTLRRWGHIDVEVLGDEQL